VRHETAISCAQATTLTSPISVEENSIGARKEMTTALREVSKTWGGKSAFRTGGVGALNTRKGSVITGETSRRFGGS